jgi:hypothetical protein
MRDIREDLFQRKLGIVSRYFDAMTRFDEQLQKLHECHRKLMAEINSERGAIDAMLAIENGRPAGELKASETQTTTTLLQSLSDIVQRYPWENRSHEEAGVSPRERESNLMHNSAHRGEPR